MVLLINKTNKLALKKENGLWNKEVPILLLSAQVKSLTEITCSTLFHNSVEQEKAGVLQKRAMRMVRYLEVMENFKVVNGRS